MSLSLIVKGQRSQNRLFAIISVSKAKKISTFAVKNLDHLTCEQFCYKNIIVSSTVILIEGGETTAPYSHARSIINLGRYGRALQPLQPLSQKRLIASKNVVG